MQSHERELPRIVTRPAPLELNADFDDVQSVVADDGRHFSRDLAARRHAPKQHQEGGHAAGSHQHGHDGSQHAAPVVEFQQDDRVPDQRQVGHGQQVMDFKEMAVRKALDQGQNHQRQRRVKRPFADALGQMALVQKELLDQIRRQGGSGRAHRALQQPPAHQPFGSLGHQPVSHGQRQPRNAQPFVQAVHLVEAAQIRFEHDGANGQQHRHAHDADAQHAGVLHQHRPPTEQATQARPVGLIGEPPETCEQQQVNPENTFYGLHLTLLFAGFQRRYENAATVPPASVNAG